MPDLSNQTSPGIDLLRRRLEAAMSAPRPLIVAQPSDPHLQATMQTDRVLGGPVMIETAIADGRWLLFSQKRCDIVRYSAEELLQMSFQDITYPADIQQMHVESDRSVWKAIVLCGE